MLDWLKKLGGGKPWQNKAGLDDKSIELLAEDFAVLEPMNPGLPEEILHYLLDGGNADVLNRLTGMKGVGEVLGVVSSFNPRAQPDKERRRRFFQQLQKAPPDFFARLGKVYEAVTFAPMSLPQFQNVQRRTFLPEPVFGNPKLNWLDVFLITSTGLTLSSYPPRCSSYNALTAELIETLLAGEGFGEERLVRAAFLPELARFGSPAFEPIFAVLKGLDDSAVRHKTTLLEILDHPDFKQRVYALELMKKCGVPLEPFGAKLVELATGSSKQVRELTEVLMAEAKPVFIPLLKEKITNGENDERVAAVRLLWRWEGESLRPYLEQRLAEEKSKKVAQAIRDLLAVPGQVEVQATDDSLRLPDLPPIPDQVLLGTEAEKAWRECFDHINRGIPHVKAANPKNTYATALQPISPDILAQCFADLQGGKSGGAMKILAQGLIFKEISGPIITFCKRPELKPIHFARFLVQIGGLSVHPGDDRHHLFSHWVETIAIAYHRAQPDAGLRDFAAACAAVGLEPDRLGRDLLYRYGPAKQPYGISREKAWPYWMDHLDLLEAAFAPPAGDFMQRYYQRDARVRAFDILASFPKPPARLLPLLWNIALGSKSERPQAQQCLEGVPDKVERLIAALAGGSSESRLAAAEWLGRVGDKQVIEPLLTALKREKTEATKGAMLLALEQLGAPVDQFLDRAGLLKEAEKGLAKGVPEDLKWFPFDQLPPIHWQDNGKKIEPAIVHWWLVQGFKLKSPEPGALLRRYCASLKTPEREALGQFVLDAWIAEDTSPITRAEAEKRAQANAQSALYMAQYFYNQAQQNKANQPNQPAVQPPLTLDQYYEQALVAALKFPKGSAVSSKGILAVAGACVGAAAAPTVSRYLKEWYGQRAAQCRAMLQMLAWVEHRTATQLLLAVGSRFRTKSIQEEANTQAQALAERKGWTVAELADRTIPSAGLDENGVMTIDYGPRKFTARLDEDLDFALTDAEEKALKALPDPRKDDDEALATEAKKNYSAAKKELKSVLTMQRERFYEAMCTQRTWPFEDWNLYLNRHPIVRHHCQRLVWAVIRDGKTVQLFRPLPDGSLTDVADETVNPDSNDLIRLAHECQVSPEQSQAWRQHFKDYNVETLFDQFGRQNFKLSDENAADTEVADFKGHVLEAFKLRGRATKLGYTRGQAQDGGWFYDYHRRFPTLGMEAVIEFSGNGLPEENRTVALTALRFGRVGEDTDSFGDGGTLALSDVPSVLLSECWNDIRSIAAEGPGFDPEWEKKAQI